MAIAIVLPESYNLLSAKIDSIRKRFMIYCYQICLFARYSTWIISLTLCFIRLMKKIWALTPVITLTEWDNLENGGRPEGGSFYLFYLLSIPLSSFLQLLWLCSALPSCPQEASWQKRRDFYASEVFCRQSCFPCFSPWLFPPPSIHPSIHPSFILPLHIHLSLSQVSELIALSWRKKTASGDKHWSTSLPGLLF